MRIIAGMLKGRRFESPRKGVRPTRDRVRESIFAILGELLVEAEVLDLYAGSGGLGLEALSRGARAVCWVEQDRATAVILRRNVAALAAAIPGARTRIVCGDARRFLARGASGSFGLVFADPPYEKSAAGEFGHLLTALAVSGVLVPGGVLVYEMSSGGSLELPSDWELLRDKSWGETRALFLRRRS
jgi:16S rRNA (guanine966-N2)-methyltransferase